MKDFVRGALVLSVLVLVGCAGPISNTTVLQDPSSGKAVFAPQLKLEVQVDPSSTLNVVFTARWDSLPTADLTPLPQRVNFYIGDPSVVVFPSKFVGSAPFDRTGTATLRIHLENGKYAGGATYQATPSGPTYASNIVLFSVPAPISIELKVLTRPDLPIVLPENILKANVVFVAHVTYNVPVITPLFTTVDFYTDKIEAPGFPSQYLGSSRTDISGNATFYAYQSVGKYKGGAVVVKDPWGKTVSNVVPYAVLID